MMAALLEEVFQNAHGYAEATVGGQKFSFTPLGRRR